MMRCILTKYLFYFSMKNIRTFIFNHRLIFTFELSVTLFFLRIFDVDPAKSFGSMSVFVRIF